MKLAGTLAGVLRRYGQTVTLCPESGEERQVKAFLQPILEGKRQEIPTAIGRRDRGRFLYLAAPEGAPVGLGKGCVRMDGTGYTVRTARPIRVGDQISHWWAVLEVQDRGERP